jgi:hypothetical protein
MFDPKTQDEPNGFGTIASKASDRVAIRYALAMTAAVMVFSVASAIGVAAAFPPDPATQPPWSAQPMLLL